MRTCSIKFICSIHPYLFDTPHDQLSISICLPSEFFEESVPLMPSQSSSIVIELRRIFGEDFPSCGEDLSSCAVNVTGLCWRLPVAIPLAASRGDLTLYDTTIATGTIASEDVEEVDDDVLAVRPELIPLLDELLPLFEVPQLHSRLAVYVPFVMGDGHSKEPSLLTSHRATTLPFSFLITRNISTAAKLDEANALTMSVTTANFNHVEACLSIIGVIDCIRTTDRIGSLKDWQCR